MGYKWGEQLLGTTQIFSRTRSHTELHKRCFFMGGSVPCPNLVKCSLYCTQALPPENSALTQKQLQIFGRMSALSKAELDNL